jgi:5-methylcytosine-specific restriction endonuclease McrA
VPRAGQVARWRTGDVPFPEDRDVELLSKVVRLLAAGDRNAARVALGPFVLVTIDTRPITQRPTVRLGARPVASAGHTKNPSPSVIAQVWVRDRFTCAYCGRRTLPPQILRLISAAFPTGFPYHKNWKRNVTARPYWDVAASIDHIHPVSLGGDWKDMGNLTCSCYRCQHQKSNIPLVTLGWTRTQPVGDWDGAVGRYEAAWRAIGEPDEVTHRMWIGAFNRALNRPR